MKYMVRKSKRLKNTIFYTVNVSLSCKITILPETPVFFIISGFSLCMGIIVFASVILQTFLISSMPMKY